MAKDKKNADLELIDLLDKIKSDIKAKSNEQYIPNIIEFCNSKHYLNLPGRDVNLFPIQKIILKVFYRGQPGNENLELEEEELKLLFEYKLDTVIEKYHSGKLFRELVLVLGRRAGKDFLVSLMALYEVMRLLEIPSGSPFKFYKIAEGNPIFILTVANSADQAKILFTEMKEKMTSSDYFKDKIGHVEADKIHMLTPQDRVKQQDLLASGLDNAASKMKGSVVIMSGHSNSESLLGKRIYALLLDEVASFKTTGGSTSGDRIYSALSPATADFVRRPGGVDENGEPIAIMDSKIISISSPRAEEGMLFRLYNETADSPNRLAFKLPTWKVNKQWNENMLRQEFKFMSANEFNMEFGAEFSGTAGEKYISDSLIDEAIEIGVELGLTQRDVGIPGMVYYAHLDPALSSHNYALVVVHVEERIRLTERGGNVVKEKTKMFIVDHIKVWQPSTKSSINVFDVDNYIADLAKRFRFAMVSYDTWNSESSRLKLRNKGIPVKITAFRREYKMRIYDHLEQLFVNHQIALPRKGPFAQMLEMELKCLKRVYLPTGYRIEPNAEAPITTDDCCVHPCTPVFTDSGIKHIIETKVGDKVLTHNGRMKRVAGMSSHKPQVPCYELQPYFGLSIIATGNHPFEVFNNGEKYWKNLDQLSLSDKIVRSFDTCEQSFQIDLMNFIDDTKCKNHEVNIHKINDEIPMIKERNPNGKWHRRFIKSDYSLGYLFGLYIAEGNIEDHGIAISAHIEDTSTHNKFKDHIYKIFGFLPSKIHKREGKGGQFHVNSTVVKKMFSCLFGPYKATQKRIPPLAMRAPRTFQLGLLQGWFDGDGSHNKKGITFTTTSRFLVYQLQQILLRNGIVSSISISKRSGNQTKIGSRTINCNADLYNVRVVDAKSYNKMAEILSLDTRKQQSKFHKIRYEMPNEHSIVVPIRKIEQYSCLTVANLSVEDDNSYVAGNFNTHNCDALAGATGSAMEAIFTGYPQSGLVQLPQIPSQGTPGQWNIGSGRYTSQEWNFYNSKFGM